MGFSAVEIVNRQFVVSFLPTCLIVAESARLVQFQVSGQFLGLLIGSTAGSFVQTSSEFNLTLPTIVIQNTGTSTQTSAASGNRKLLVDTDPSISIATIHNSTHWPAEIEQLPEPTSARSHLLRRLSSSNPSNASETTATSMNEIYAPTMSPSAWEQSDFEVDQNQVGRLTAANWFMVTLWLMYLVYILVGWNSSNKSVQATKKEVNGDPHSFDYESDVNESYNSTDSSVSDKEIGRTSLLKNSSKFRAIGVDGSFEEVESETIPDNKKSRRKRDKSRSPKRKRRRKIRTFTKRIRKLMLYSVAIPVALVFIVWTVFAQEVLFSSCALITKSYFSWRGSVTGLFLASLWVILLPMDYFCEQLARRYEERFTVRVSELACF